MNSLTKKMDWARADFALLVCILLLIIIGAGSIYSASSYRSELRYGNSEYFFIKQLIRAAIGLALMILVARKDYRLWLSKSYFLPWLTWVNVLVGISMIFLILLAARVPFITPANGAYSWIKLGPFSFQPSDFARYALIMLLAKKLSDWRESLGDLSSYVKLFGLTLLIAGPTALEHDLGTAALTVIIAFSMFFFAEIKLSYMAATAMGATSLALYYVGRNPYMLERILSFLRSIFGGELHHQMKQSIIALVQGGLIGQGIGASRQKYLYLPEAHNDFIFAMIGEEYGLIGTIVLLLLFLVIIHRGLTIAQQAPDLAGRYLAGGITACYASYALINAAVVVGLFPTTGIPMPFLSYGGTSLVTHLGALGLLLNISAQGSPAHAVSPTWREYRQRIEERAFPQPVPTGARRGSVRKTVALHRSYR